MLRPRRCGRAWAGRRRCNPHVTVPSHRQQHAADMERHALSGDLMKLVYDSSRYWLVEYPLEHAFELIDRRGARLAFVQGHAAARFLRCLRNAVAELPTFEHIDGVLSASMAELPTARVVFH